MTGFDQFELWFENHSSSGGQAVVYQALANVKFNGSGLEQLAWLVTGANPDVWVRFVWQVDYGFVWTDTGEAESGQHVAADPETSNQISLSYNQFGFQFGPAHAGSPAGTLLIAEDASIPTLNQAVAGIGMDGAGTFAVAARPNQQLAFTPADPADLGYLITFGTYALDVGDVLEPATLNPPGTIAFPAGVTAMTAVLDSSNSWTVTPGAPQDPMLFRTYQAGIGFVS